MNKLLIGGILAGACLVPLAASAHTSVSVGIGVPLIAPAPVYYDPPPVVYAPPAPVYYGPPPVVYGAPGYYYGPRYAHPYRGYYRRGW